MVLHELGHLKCRDILVEPVSLAGGTHHVWLFSSWKIYSHGFTRILLAWLILKLLKLVTLSAKPED